MRIKFWNAAFTTVRLIKFFKVTYLQGNGETNTCPVEFTTQVSAEEWAKARLTPETTWEIAPDQKYDTHTNISSPYSEKMGANAWLKRCIDGCHDEDGKFVDNVVSYSSSLDYQIIDDPEEYAYQPKWECTMEVITKKTITVTIDSEEYGDVEDEYDAGQKARELIENGDFDHELDYADNDSFEVEEEYVEEVQ